MVEILAALNGPSLINMRLLINVVFLIDSYFRVGPLSAYNDNQEMTPGRRNTERKIQRQSTKNFTASFFRFFLNH